MLKFLLHRLIFTIIILWLISVIVFAVTEILPGDTANFILANYATPESLAALRVQLGLDQPLYTRYWAWIGGIFQGDWGDSLLLRRPVLPILLDRFYYSAILGGAALLIGTPLGIFLGLIAGLWRGSWLDQTILISTIVAISVPPFVVAIFLVIIFATWLQWLPASSMLNREATLSQTAYVLILPTLTLVLGIIAPIARHTRSSLIDVLQSDYLRTARSKGIANSWVIVRHALPNALLPTISVVALNVGFLLSGVVLVEIVFAYPGLGRLMLQAINSRDLPLIQSVALVMAATYTLANLTADILYMYFNPRVRYT